MTRIVASVLLLAACTGEDTASGGAGGSRQTATIASSTRATSSPASSDAASGSGGANGLVWTPCPLFTGEPGTDAECVVTDAPLSWDTPDGPTIDLFVKRVPAASQPARAQLWLLYGGPGGSGVAFEGIAEYLAAYHPDVDVYMPEHRGVGGSSRLGCPEQESEASDAGVWISDAERPACLAAIQAQWGAGLADFSTSNAARDLGHLVDATRAPDQQVIVFGVSYGTMLAHRYLQWFPDQPTGVVVDSNCIPDCDFAVNDRWFDDLAHKLAAACADDATCASRLGADPATTIAAGVARLEDGTCPDVAALGFDRAIFQQLVGQSLYGFDDRMLLFALGYRLSRCSPADVHAFEYLALALGADVPPSATDLLDSGMLGDNIGVSELWPDPGPIVEEARAELDGMEVALRTGEYYATVDDYWPRYPRDAFSGALTSSSVPMLILQGEDDFIPGSWVAPVAARFSGPMQTYVSLPRTPHGAITGSPAGPSGFPCGFTILEQFVDDPTAALDTSCTDDVLPYEFTLLPDLASSYLGTPDAWDGDPGPQPIAAHLDRASAQDRMRRRLERMRRR